MTGIIKLRITITDFLGGNWICILTFYFKPFSYIKSIINMLSKKFNKNTTWKIVTWIWIWKRQIANIGFLKKKTKAIYTDTHTHTPIKTNRILQQTIWSNIFTYFFISKFGMLRINYLEEKELNLVRQYTKCIF